MKGLSARRFREKRLGVGAPAAMALVAGLVILVAQPTPGTASEGPCPGGVELPEQISLFVEGELDPAVLWEVCMGVVALDARVREAGQSLSAATVYVVDTPDAARRRAGALGMRPPPGRVWGQSLAGLASGTRVVMLNQGFHLAVHELVHVFQHPTTEATWLVEGAAEYIAFDLDAAHRGVRPPSGPTPYYSNFLGFFTTKGVTFDLRRLESYRTFHQTGTVRAHYGIARAGFDVLMSETDDGLDQYLSCFVPQKARSGWRAAFVDCFGMTPDDLYQLFDEFQVGGFAEFPRDRRERERLEFERLVDECLVDGVYIGLTPIVSSC